MCFLEKLVFSEYSVYFVETFARHRSFDEDKKVCKQKRGLIESKEIKQEMKHQG